MQACTKTYSGYANLQSINVHLLKFKLNPLKYFIMPSLPTHMLVYDPNIHMLMYVHVDPVLLEYRLHYAC